MRFTSVFVSILGILLLCRPAAFAAERSKRSLGDRIDAIAGEVFPGNGPGGVVTVLKDGKILHQGFYGYQDIPNKTAFTADS